MKINVDLTENRDFRFKASTSVQGTPLGVQFAFDGRPIPSNILYNKRFGVLTDEYYIEYDNGAVAQGNQLERLSKRLCGEFGMGEHCDCCGKELKPYVNDCLCDKCNDNIDSRNNFFEDFI